MESEKSPDPDSRSKRETLGLEDPPARVKRESCNLRLKHEPDKHDPRPSGSSSKDSAIDEHGAGERLPEWCFPMKVFPEELVDDAGAVPKIVDGHIIQGEYL